MTFSQWIKIPKGYTLIALLFLLAVTTVLSKDTIGLQMAGISVLSAVLTDFVCRLFVENKRGVLDSAMITGLIIALILSGTTSWVVLASTTAIAIVSKYLIVYRDKVILNPAAVGLLVSILLFQSGQSWWGAFGDLPAWSIGFLIVAGYIVTYRVNKAPQMYAFLGTFFAITLILGLYHTGDAYDMLRPPFINASLFFGFFMMTDPPTSPAKVGDQVIFGIAIALIASFISWKFGGLMYLFIALLIGNLLHLMMSKVWVRKTQAIPVKMKPNSAKVARR